MLPLCKETKLSASFWVLSFSSSAALVDFKLIMTLYWCPWCEDHPFSIAFGPSSCIQSSSLLLIVYEALAFCCVAASLICYFLYLHGLMLGLCLIQGYRPKNYHDQPYLTNILNHFKRVNHHHCRILYYCWTFNLRFALFHLHLHLILLHLFIFYILFLKTLLAFNAKWLALWLDAFILFDFPLAKIWLVSCWFFISWRLWKVRVIDQTFFTLFKSSNVFCW